MVFAPLGKNDTACGAAFVNRVAELKGGFYEKRIKEIYSRGADGLHRSRDLVGSKAG